MLIHDTAVDLCVVSAPKRHLATLGCDGNDQTWDFLSVDKDMRMVMLAGERFHELSGNDTHLMAFPNACLGKPMANVFAKPILDILTPLVEMTLEGKSPQLHTIYKSQGLTLFAYPFYNETHAVIGAHVVYRPTTYDRSDITNILSRTTADVER